MIWIPHIAIVVAAFLWAIAWSLYFRFNWIRIGFIKRNPKFWNAQASYSQSKTVGGYKIDGFHLLQSATFGLLLAAPLLYQPIFKWWIDYAIFGGLWTVCFPLFYGLIAPRPKRLNNRL